MGANTNIQWTDATWNPVRGCSRVSEGCRNCYAEKVAARFSGPGLPYEGLARVGVGGGARWTGEVRMVPEHLADPLRWTRPRRVFVNSMSDLFHEKLTNEEIAAVFGVMAAAPRHTFQLLTKRAERMREWFAWFRGELGDEARAENLLSEGYADAVFDGSNGDHDAKTCEMLDRIRDAHDAHLDEMPWPLPNVHLGVSVEDQETADERIPHLLATPAAVRFVSYEPALGPVDFTSITLPDEVAASARLSVARINALTDQDDEHYFNDHAKLDWIIVGGESGPGARPFDISWARSTVEQCRAAGTAVFVKQLGKRPRFPGEAAPWRPRDGKAGDPAEWPEDLRVREFPGGAP